MSKQVTIYGEVIEIDDDLLGIVEEINFRWPALRVVYLDPEQHHDIFDAPYRILEMCKDGVERKVIDVWALDKSVIAKLHELSIMDVAENLQAAIDKANAAAQKEKDRKFREALGAASDVAAHALAHPATTYSFKDSEGDVVTIDDSGPTKRKSEGRTVSYDKG